MNNNEMNNEKKPSGKGKGAKKQFYAILTCVFALIFLGSVIWLIKYFVQNHQAAEDMENIKSSYVQEVQPTATPIPENTPKSSVTPAPETPAPTAVPTESPSPYLSLDNFDVPEKTIDFAALQKETNEHIYAWITVPGTVIDYPVLQHPEVLSYYLDRNLDHSTGYPGCVFSQLYNSKEWDDPMTVLYGHNMKNGTMFAGLHQYADSEFFTSNPYVYIYTEEKIRVYEIFAAYEYTDVDLVLMRLYGGEEQYEEYLKSIYTLEGMKNNFNTEIEVTTEDKILTLATCIANKADRRYLVQAVLVGEGDA